MKIEKFKSLIEEKIEEIETIIDDNMIQVGNKATDCQKIYLQQQLNEFSCALNGTINLDLKK